MLALLQTLNADLLSHESATLTLERWCAAHRLATPPKIVAERMADQDEPASAEVRKELRVSGTTLVRYRRVRLACGSIVLSEADNWYVPDRLTADMNKTLESTDTPFGKAVQALNFQRHTLAATWLWTPLPEGWEMNAAAADDQAEVVHVPEKLLEQRALLTLPDGTPFSEVVETYERGVLDFAPPRR